MNILTRDHTHYDINFLQEMLYEAVFWRPNISRPPIKEGLSHPDIAKVLSNWGRDGDTAVIAYTEEGERVGAVWYRFWTHDNHSYGFVTPDIPEIGIGVKQKYRRRGIGNALLTQLIEISINNNIKQLSLSVEKDNPAQHLYKKHHFKKVKTIINALTMVRTNS